MPDGNGQVQPWIALVVVPVVPGRPDPIQHQSGAPLPFLRCPAALLPKWEESWAWAHAQVVPVGQRPVADVLTDPAAGAVHAVPPHLPDQAGAEHALRRLRRADVRSQHPGADPRGPERRRDPPGLGHRGRRQAAGVLLLALRHGRARRLRGRGATAAPRHRRHHPRTRPVAAVDAGRGDPRRRRSRGAAGAAHAVDDRHRSRPDGGRLGARGRAGPPRRDRQPGRRAGRAADRAASGVRPLAGPDRPPRSRDGWVDR